MAESRKSKPPPGTAYRRIVGEAQARGRVLAAWRGVDVTPLEKERQATAKTVASIMPGVVKGLGLDRRRAEVEILKVWNAVIDPNVTAHAQPTALVKGTLMVTVDNSVWLHEIVRYRRREILERLQHSFGKDTVARISFRVG